MGEILNLQSQWDEIGARYLSGESTYDIAKEIGAFPANIRQILIKLNIPRRSRKEIAIKAANSIILSENLQSRVNGWLLGDGSLSFSGLSGMFSLSSKHKEYINFVKKLFVSEGIKCRTYGYKDKKSKTFGYRLFTLSTLEFGELYNEWYPNCKKIIPKKLLLDSYSIKHWIMDDGTVSKTKGHLRLSTCCFSIEDCERLSEMLNNFIGIKNASHVIEKDKYPRIYVPKKITKSLLDLIGECEISCFQYKWNNNKI